MSKERDLLEKFCNSAWIYSDWLLLKAEVETLLAQSKREPVAWMQDSIELYVEEEKDVKRGYIIPLYTTLPEQEPVTNEPTTTAMAVMPNGVCVSNVYDAYEEGRKSVMVEQEPEFGDGPEFDGWEKRSGNSLMQEPVAWMNNDFEFYANEEKYVGNLIPLYTSPPKQELIDLDQVDKHLKTCDLSEDYRDGYIDGIIFAEREHKIRGKYE